MNPFAMGMLFNMPIYPVVHGREKQPLNHRQVDFLYRGLDCCRVGQSKLEALYALDPSTIGAVEFMQSIPYH